MLRMKRKMTKAANKPADKAGKNTRAPRNKRQKTEVDFGNNNQSQSNVHGANLAPSSSSDSVIYVGEYFLNSECPIIDLTDNEPIVQSDNSSVSIKPQKSPKNIRFIVINKQHPLRTVSCSELMINEKKKKTVDREKDSKSTGCLIAPKFKTQCPILENFGKTIEEPHLLKHVDQVTELNEEDQDVISCSLAMQDDYDILQTCVPRIQTMDQPIEKLTELYEVSWNDNFN